MLVNLKESLIEFLVAHEVNFEDIEYVSYYCQFNEATCHCDFVDFIEVADEINFEEYDPLIKNREMIKPGLKIIASDWFVTLDGTAETLWRYSELSSEKGEYEPITEEDLIVDEDNIDNELRSFLDVQSENGKYVRDNITIGGKEYAIQTTEGIQKVLDDEGRVAVILAANPNGQYWTALTDVPKDPQMLFYPELVKIVMEYNATLDMPDYPLLDADIASVFDLEEINKTYHLDVSGFDATRFNNLRVAFLPQGHTYRISYTGAASTPELRHEIILIAKPEDNIVL